MEFELRIAVQDDVRYADEISALYRVSAQERGTGIAMRKPEYISARILSGHGIISLCQEKLAGFCYIETFGHGKYVSNSGLIVVPDYRGLGLATRIKKLAFNHARHCYPEAKVFGITTSNRVMEINSNLGYIPVAFYKLTDDNEFWAGCKSCPNYHILETNNRSMCLCTGMLAPSLNEVVQNETQLKPENKTTP